MHQQTRDRDVSRCCHQSYTLRHFLVSPVSKGNMYTWIQIGHVVTIGGGLEGGHQMAVARLVYGSRSFTAQQASIITNLQGTPGKYKMYNMKSSGPS